MIMSFIHLSWLCGACMQCPIRGKQKFEPWNSLIETKKVRGAFQYFCRNGSFKCTLINFSKLCCCIVVNSRLMLMYPYIFKNLNAVNNLRVYSHFVYLRVVVFVCDVFFGRTVFARTVSRCLFPVPPVRRYLSPFSFPHGK